MVGDQERELSLVNSRDHHNHSNKSSSGQLRNHALTQTRRSSVNEQAWSFVHFVGQFPVSLLCCPPCFASPFAFPPASFLHQRSLQCASVELAAVDVHSSARGVIDREETSIANRENKHVRDREHNDDALRRNYRLALRVDHNALHIATLGQQHGELRDVSALRQVAVETKIKFFVVVEHTAAKKEQRLSLTEATHT